FSDLSTTNAISLGINSQPSVNITQSDVGFLENVEEIENFATFENSQTTDSPNLSQSLAEWVVQHNISHQAINALLPILKKSISSHLPSDARTLLKTPRTVAIRRVEPGHYYHFGLESTILKLAQSLDLSRIKDNTIYININVDGLRLCNSSKSQVHPILGCIEGYNEVGMIGTYHGFEKTNDANLKIKSLICDVPAKSFLKYTKGHAGYSSCTKCHIVGKNIDKRTCFPETENISLRTDVDFRSKTDPDHHSGTLIIEKIPGIHMINSFPLDYMHLICLGVVKKLVSLWCCGKRRTKISQLSQNNISLTLINLSTSMPREFMRKPRSLDVLKRWKATEFRQFLLYTGPVVLLNNITPDRYLNFLTLYAAFVILSHRKYFDHLDYAIELLEYFVETFKSLYEPKHVSHNVHNLLETTWGRGSCLKKILSVS
ncbi:uncharacterized protein LOC143377055, partial [Andrena cerasifolii]|uniref:uncharacterized protein LOC143377055 n=1 Tax=Andrena cerasifolii TaxID=2819439 RepID=UPI0040382DE3